MRIRTQFLITIGLFGLILFAIAISLIITNQQVSRLSRQLSIANNVERGARELSYLSNDFLLYRENQQRTRWESKFAAFSNDVSSLEPSTPEQQALVNNIRSNQERLKAVFADVVSTLQASDIPEGATGMAFIQVSWSRMEVQNQGMVFDAELLSEKIHAETDQLQDTNDLLILALVGLFGAYFVANYGLIYRHTLQSISDLQEGAKIIGSGQLDYRISEKSNDEVGELARAFNRMTTNLREVTASKTDLEKEIAERKKAEASLQQALEEANRGKRILQALMESVPEGITIADASENIQMVSHYGQELLGSPHAGMAVEHVAKQWQIYEKDGVTRMKPEDTPLARAIRQGLVVCDAELVQIDSKGQALQILCNAAPFRDSQGKVAGGVVAWQDITARKRAEDALRASEERYRSLFESINEGFALHEIICDSNGTPVDYRFLEMNPAFERLTGLKRGEIIGKTVRSVLPDVEDYRIQAFGEVALTGTPAHFENYASALGQHYEVFAHRPTPGQFAVLFLNVTERKQAEERIRKLNQALEQQAEELQQINVQLEETLAEEQVAREEAETGRNILESLMQYAPEVIFIADAPDAGIRMISRYAETLLGQPLPRLSAVTADEHPLSRGLFYADGVTRMAYEEIPIVRAVKRGETILDHELVLYRSDGAKRTLLANAGPIRDARGTITGGIATWRDITVRKQIEQQVQTLNRDLERRAVELEMANKELESFSYSVSHDLRTPLASISGFANLLLKDCGTQLPPEALRYLELIRENSIEMNQLVNGLLAFSRFMRQPLRKQTVDLNKLVRQALEDLHAQQQDRRIEIEIGDLPACQADPVLLKQVLVNLLSNALKFTRNREVARIEIGATRTDDGELLYSVSDNGVGFDPEQADNLFGVFQRLHSQEDYEGTGVGLAIVERIVKRHGGRVYAESQVDEGASFHFTIPS